MALDIGHIIGHRSLNTVTDGVLTVAAYKHFFPISSQSKSGRFSGIDVDIVRLFAKTAGLKLKLVPIDKFDKIWDLPRKRKVDTAIGGIANLESRTAKGTEWTIPYYYVKRSLLFNVKDPVDRFPESVTRTVLGTVGSSGWLDAQLRARPLRKDHHIRPGSTDEADLKSLKSGKVQGVIRGSFVSRAWVAKFPRVLDYIEWECDESILPSDGEVFAFPCATGSGVAVALSTFIAKLAADGTLAKLLRKHKL